MYSNTRTHYRPWTSAGRRSKGRRARTGPERDSGISRETRSCRSSRGLRSQRTRGLRAHGGSSSCVDKKVTSAPSHERGRRYVHSEHRVRVACADEHVREVSDRTGGSQNECGEEGPRLTFRDGHVERKVNEIIGLQYGLPGRKESFSWRVSGWLDRMKDTHEEKAEGAESAAGGCESRTRTRHIAGLVAHHVRSPEKRTE